VVQASTGRRDICTLIRGRHSRRDSKERHRRGAVLLARCPDHRRARDRRRHEGIYQSVVRFHVGNQPNDPFNGSIRCLGYGQYSDSGAIWEVDRCTGIDADNDEFEVNWSGPEDPVHGKILGGTGKYKGVKGTITAIGNAWPSLSKADSMFAGQYKWEYKIGD
jgi:hypothetical protein